MDTLIEIDEQVFLSENKIKEVNEKILEVIKNELPNEVQTIGVINYILEELKEHLKSKIVRL